MANADKPSSCSIWKRLVGLLKDGEDPAEKARKRDDEKPAGAEEPSEEHAKVHLTAGAASADFEWESDEGDSEPPAPTAGGGGGGVGATIWKVIGAAATGITATGFVVAIGGAIFWIRFDEVGLPATQAVGLLAKNELLVQGAEETIVFAGVAVAAVGLLFVVSPQGRMTRWPFGLLVLLTIVAVVYAFMTGLPWGLQIALSLMALALLACVVVVGVRSGKSFWPLALALFVASLVFSAAAGLLVVQHQSYAQAVAVLRGDGDAGVTGIYVTANDKTLYLGHLIPQASDEEPDRRGMFDVPRAGATFAVGPLESIGKTEAEASELLEQLKNDRERNPGTTAATNGASSEGDEGAPPESGGTEAAADGSAASPPESIAAVAGAFTGPVSVHHTVTARWGCLVQFASAERTDLGHWWTTCAENDRFEEMTMLEVRQELALPGRFQPVYDKRSIGRLPRGLETLYLTGNAESQCEHDPPTGCGHFYAGGAIQVYLPEPQLVEVESRECTTTRQDQIPAWAGCSPR